MPEARVVLGGPERMFEAVEHARPRVVRSVVVRGACLFAVWLAIAGAKPADLPVGIVVTAGAVWASLMLLPPATASIRPLALAHLLGRLLWLSLVAGVDVAHRALSPRMALDPGFVRYRSRLAPGPARSVFTSLISLVPGTVPAGTDADGTILVHCLDRSQSVAEDMARDEALFRRALGESDARAGDD